MRFGMLLKTDYNARAFRGQRAALVNLCASLHGGRRLSLVNRLLLLELLSVFYHLKQAACSSQPIKTMVASPGPEARRRAAAEYIRGITGVAVPHACDGAFRAALSDGVLLCAAVNAAFPGAVAQVRAARIKKLPMQVQGAHASWRYPMWL